MSAHDINNKIECWIRMNGLCYVQLGVSLSVDGTEFEDRRKVCIALDSEMEALYVYNYWKDKVHWHGPKEDGGKFVTVVRVE